MRCLALLLCLLLAACGGGNDPDQFTGPPDCSKEACR